MDVNDMRIAVMVLGLVLFLGIWAWSWSAKRREAFDEAARLPFADDEPVGTRAAAPQTAGAARATFGENK